MEARVGELLDLVQLRGYGDRFPSQLSGGQRQRVALARALAPRPAVLLLDEPEAGLDPRATEVMSDILETINSGERTVVMTTHNLERGIELSDEVIILHEGKVVYQASRQEIDAAGFRQTYNRCTGMSA